MNEPILVCEDLQKSYPSGDLRIEVLKNLNLTVARGEMVAVTGESGVGKSTLIHLIAALDEPDHGSIQIAGRNPFGLVNRQRAAYRNREIGLVFQFHHLLSEFSALENVILPGWMGGTSRQAARRTAEGLLLRLSLGARMHHLPSHLSGGEQQRVAIARALINSPSLLLADEPTGNLDAHTAEVVFDCIRDLNRIDGLTVLLVTHHHRFAGHCDRILSLHNGHLTDGFWRGADPPGEPSRVGVGKE